MTIYRLSSAPDPAPWAWTAFGAWLRSQTHPARWLPPRWHHPVVGYLAATLLTLLASGATLLLEVLFPPLVLQGSLLGLVLVFVALSWGNAPSLLATLLGTFLLAGVVLPLHFSWAIDTRSDAASLALYVLSGVTISLIAGQVEQARRRAERLAQEAG